MFLYAFPRKDIEVYRKWLMVCDIEESVEKEVSPKVCDQCFEIDDFYPVIGNETRRKLKNNSFPKRKKSNPTQIFLKTIRTRSAINVSI